VTDVMIDLETFDTAPTAAIVQLGAVTFDPTGSMKLSEARRFEVTISLQSAVLAGLTFGVSTTAWWQGTAPTAARAAISRGPMTPLAEALIEFTRWYETVKPNRLWSHGAAFDVPILDHAYRAFDQEPPWDYRSVRDTRTLFDLASQLVDWRKPERSTAHTALADATDQAADVISAFAALTRPEKIVGDSLIIGGVPHPIRYTVDGGPLPIRANPGGLVEPPVSGCYVGLTRND